MRNLKLSIAYTSLLVLLTACGGGGSSSTQGNHNDTITKSLTKDNSNLAPLINGVPSAIITTGSSYQFMPESSDPENANLTFQITNKPLWLSFNPATGELSGTPASSDVGLFSDILVTVSDGVHVSSLPPFSITVEEKSLLPLQISGSPPLIAQENRAYSFTPVATNNGRNSLLFSVLNRPSWLTFDSATGRLSGTPAESDVGTYSDIQLFVNDGVSEASLASFNITVTSTSATLSWVPPSTRVDNSVITLSELGGFKIYSGRDATNLSLLVDIADPTVNEYKIDGLATGTHFFAMTVYDQFMVESDFSSIASKTIY